MRAVTSAAQMAGASATTASTTKYQGFQPANRASRIAMARAAAVPAVPGATGEYPQPNQVATATAILSRIAPAEATVIDRWLFVSRRGARTLACRVYTRVDACRQCEASPI